MQYLLTLKILLLHLTFILAQVYIQAETFPLAESSRIQQMSGASNGLALHMPDYSTLQYDICIDKPMHFDLGFRYSKEINNEVNVKVFIDRNIASIHKTSDTQGPNNFVDSSTELYLMNGRYTLTLQFEDKSLSDFKIDYVKLSCPDMPIRENVLCSKYETIRNSHIVEVEQLTNSRFSWRSNASNKKSVLVHKGESVTYDICIDTPINMTIDKVVYSNDGASDVIRIDVNGNKVGDFNTVGESSAGLFWDVFRSVGPIGKTIRFTPGKHKLSLRVVDADAFGVELDYFSLNIIGFSTKRNPLQCGVDVEIEAEQFENVNTKMRSSASNGRTVHLDKNESVEKGICFAVDTSVSLNKLVYSNDGKGDTIAVSLDNIPRASINTQTSFNGGRNWNIFKTISLSSTTALNTGKHKISLKATESDFYGVEIDKLGLNFNFKSPLLNWWNCPIQKIFLMEAEHFQLKSSQGTKDRSQASGKKTVNLTTGNKITQTICVTGKVKLSLNNIMISNDGKVDSIAVKVQSLTIETMNTTESFRGGEGWNVIQTYKLNTGVFLNKGEYKIDIEALKTDQYGVEIDALSLKTESFGGGTLYPTACKE